MTRPAVAYLAGPMRGRPEFNFPAFHAVAATLRDAGWEVRSPAENDEANGFDPTGLTGNEDLDALGFDLCAAFAWDMAQIAACDAVVVLPGWEASRGASLEVEIARFLGKPVLVAPEAS